MTESISSATKFFAWLVCVAVAALVWWAVIYPRPIAVEWHQPLKSASFAPFYDGQSPLKKVFPTRAQIEEDLARLKGVFSGIRTYTSQDGMEVVPELAEKYGFTLTHSAWLGREKADNDKEIAALIETANRYPQAVKRVIVGNEVLLRRDLKPDELIAYIDKVRAAVKQPVSYADVWAFWLKNPQVADHVDYITIHILPYWEDEPVSLHDAQQHMLTIIDKIKQRFPGKPILVGETGWPTEGRSRGLAHADLLTAAAFVRALPQLAAEHDFDYNVVEAYDQSWKAQLEGTVGARWGLAHDGDCLTVRVKKNFPWWVL
jgi:exo-beta-1,3-glucanase (GH17 family)